LNAWGAGGKAAKAIIVKGKVSVLVDGKVTPVKRGDWLPEGAQVKTEPKSFTKLIFIDKSTMNVGPDSQMKIDSFPKSKPGVITLVKGKVRSKVTKNYMNMKDKDKSKLFIKTKTAAMGVRGTDFQVSFNPMNQATSLVTFEGAVAMAKLMGAIPPRGMQNMLEKVVSSPAAVMVRRGQYSGSSPKTKRATIPIKISPVQLETLESNETPGLPTEKKGASNKPKKNFRSVVPPGMDSKTVANEESGVDKAMTDAMGSGAVRTVEKQVEAEIGPIGDAPPPEGMVDVATGAIAPTAGGFVDLDTAQYVPPPEGSTYDANAGVYVPPPEVGYVDPATGNFTNDNYELQPDGTFTEKPPEMTTSTTTTDGATREIASIDSGDAPPPPGDEPPPPPPPEVTLLPTISDGSGPEVEYDIVFNAPPPNPDGSEPLDANKDDGGGTTSPDGDGGFDPTLAINDDGSSSLDGSVNFDDPLVNDSGGDDLLLNLRNNGLDGTGTTNVNFDITIQ
jgi:hypothetical protein